MTKAMDLIGKAGLVPVLKREDWASFARTYNGPNFRKNQYDTRMAKALGIHRNTLHNLCKSLDLD